MPATAARRRCSGAAASLQHEAVIKMPVQPAPNVAVRASAVSHAAMTVTPESPPLKRCSPPHIAAGGQPLRPIVAQGVQPPTQNLALALRATHTSVAAAFRLSCSAHSSTDHIPAGAHPARTPAAAQHGEASARQVCLRHTSNAAALSQTAPTLLTSRPVNRCKRERSRCSRNSTTCSAAAACATAHHACQSTAQLRAPSDVNSRLGTCAETPLAKRRPTLKAGTSGTNASSTGARQNRCVTR
jgi:hypothetical protein